MGSVTIKIFKGALLVELAGILVATSIFHRMDINQDFRHRLSKKWPSILNFYYKCKEIDGHHEIRKADQLKWSSDKD